MNRRSTLYKLLINAVLLALGMVLPFLTGQIPTIGQAISPLHIPVFISGLTCGWPWGLSLGLVLPILRSCIFGMPPLVAVAMPMAFELAAYGLITGLLYPLLSKRWAHLPAMLLALAAAMLAGRILGGCAKAVVMGLTGSSFTFAMFVTSYFATTAVGAVIHLILVPAVVLALERAHLLPASKPRETAA